MAYLVDGHNLIPKIKGLSLSTIDDEFELIELLQEFCRLSRRSVEVYFDNAQPGFAGAKRYGMVKAQFVRQGQTADAAILTRLRRAGRAARNWTLVTSDRSLQNEARSLQARVLSSEEFAGLILQTRRQAEEKEPLSVKEMSEEEIRQWLDLFGLDDQG